MAATIGTNHAAARQEWVNELFLGHLRNNSFAPLMGTDKKSVIRIENVMNKAGDTFKYHFSDLPSASDGVDGDAALTGSAVSMTVDDVTIDRRRFADRIENFAMSQQRTIVDMERELVMPRLESWMKSKVQKLVLDSLVDVTSGRSQNRYLYGAAEANYNATHATALQAVDSSADKLTLALISRSKRKAQLQGAGNRKIMPTRVTLKDGRTDEENFVFLGHSWAMRDLKQDTNFGDLVKYRDNPAFDVINGAQFVGKYDGVLMYEMFDTEMLVNNGTIDVAHNLLLGAGSAVMAYGNVQVPQGAKNVIIGAKGKAMVTSEVTDHAGNAEYGITFIGGARKLVNSNSEDNGVVHVFTSGVADA